MINAFGRAVYPPIRATPADGLLRTIHIDTETGGIDLLPNPGILLSGQYEAPDEWHEYRRLATQAAVMRAADYLSRHSGTQLTSAKLNQIDSEWHTLQNCMRQHALDQTRAWHINTPNAGTVYVHPTSATASNINITTNTAASATTNSITLTWPSIYDEMHYLGTDGWVVVDQDPRFGAPRRWVRAESPESYQLELKKLRKKREFQNSLAPVILNHHGEQVRSFNSAALFEGVSREEVAAIQLLRSMVSTEQFRRYLKHGFVVGQGPTGLQYQIRRENTIRVWDKGEEIAQLCFYLKLENRPAPPSDHVVAKLLIVECDEIDVWKRSNITWITDNRKRPALETLGQAVDPEKKELLGGIYVSGSSGATVYNNNLGLSVAHMHMLMKIAKQEAVGP